MEAEFRARANPFGEQWIDEYFVGREAEISVFRANLSGLRTGRPSNVLVAGLHGAGKSYYLQKLAAIAQEDGYAAVVVDLDQGTEGFDQLRLVIWECVQTIEKQCIEHGNFSEQEFSKSWHSANTFALSREGRASTGGLRDDLARLSEYAINHGKTGFVLLLDEGQRINQVALSAIKNALNKTGSCLVVLSWRLSSDKDGAVVQARQEIKRRAGSGEGDIGVSSFFGTGTSIGPFSSTDEVYGYFASRLRHNYVRFSNEVMTRIGDIADKLPRTMSELSASLYNKSLAAELDLADLPLLEDCFRETYPSEVRIAIDLCSELSETLKACLVALVRLTRRASADEIVAKAFQSSGLGQAVSRHFDPSSQLDVMCAQYPVLRAVDGGYEVTSNTYRYALMIALDQW